MENYKPPLKPIACVYCEIPMELFSQLNMRALLHGEPPPPCIAGRLHFFDFINPKAVFLNRATVPIHESLQ